MGLTQDVHSSPLQSTQDLESAVARQQKTLARKEQYVGRRADRASIRLLTHDADPVFFARLLVNERDRLKTFKASRTAQEREESKAASKLVSRRA